QERAPAMALIGLVVRNPARAAATVAQGALEALILAGASDAGNLDALTKELGDVPWGRWPTELTLETARDLRERGCDFLVLGPEKTQLEALENDEMAYFLTLPVDMEERLLRSVEELPVDGIYVDLTSLEQPLTLQHLMAVGSLRAMFSKYFLAGVTASLSSQELKSLRDIGVDGIVVHLDGLSQGDLQALRGRLASLPKRKPRTERPTATVPLSPSSSGRRRHEEEEEEEEGEGI
ncbi:MAG: hypothetical protein ACE5IG_05620, partial [Dehalococcoidia bacterium]